KNKSILAGTFFGPVYLRSVRIQDGCCNEISCMIYSLLNFICPTGRMLSTLGIVESTMSKAGLDNRHRDKDGEISHKHGNTLIRTLRKIYGQGFAAGYPDTEKLSEVLLQLNETSISQLRRDHETGHLQHKIANASK